MAGKVASLVSLILVLVLVQESFAARSRPTSGKPQTSDTTTRTTTQQEHLTSRRHASQVEKDHPPKLIHQPQSIFVKADEPHTIECAIEAKPTADIKWFKDGQLLTSQAPHSEQQNNELMFFQVNDDDTGIYHCEATNYLGSAISERFKLTVQSSVQDARLKLEPRQAEVGEDQPVEFTCSLPALPTTRKTRQQLEPEVSWRRDGKKLLVKWLDDDEELADARSRFVARKLAPSASSSGEMQLQQQQLKFALTITRVQLKDDNSTFTCLYQMPSIYSKESDGSEERLAHESNQATLRVYSELQTQPAINSVGLPDPNLGPPMYDIVNKTTQLLYPTGTTTTTTTSITDGNAAVGLPRRVNTLKQTLLDLFEIAKPTLIIFGILFLVSLFVLLKLIYLRHQKNKTQNRYMKHTSLVQQTYSGSSAGSGSSNGPTSGFGVDPVLNSLMARTLSAPHGNPLAASKLLAATNKNPANGANNNGVGGLSKKYRSYRDHMRKISDKNDPIIAGAACDFLDANFVTQLQQQLQLESQQSNSSATNPIQEGATLEPFSFLGGTTNLSRPNLYNQSLVATAAAAEQEARAALLQASEHMRSLSNLNAIAAIQQQQASCRFAANSNGSHLNLPLGFAFNGRVDNPLNAAGALWTAGSGLQNQMNVATRNLLNRTSTNGHQADEHYQLVNCSSLSPSSSSSVGSSGNGTMTITTNNSGQKAAQEKESSTSNHYSTIENNDDDLDSRYEEVDCHQQARATSSSDNNQGSFRAAGQRTSTFLARNSDQPNKQTVSLVDDSFNTRNTRQLKSADKAKNSKFHDQLSPYAVSSICGNMPPPTQPPPNSEAMRALNEQFDINQLMMLDDHSNSIPTFEVPPPPPTQKNDVKDNQRSS